MADSFLGKLANLWKPAESKPMLSDFSGEWFTTFGPMKLTQSGPKVRGVYGMADNECPIEGNISNGTLRFRYTEPDAAGEGRFELQRYGKFSGQWRQDGTDQWQPWHGHRGFDGLWQTSFGPVRLIQDANAVQGFYEGLGSSTIKGRLQGKRLVFRYQEPRAQGDAWFEWEKDGFAFQGQWRADGTDTWSPWQGQRILPVPGLVWLVVLEAYWQKGLGEKEYAFGNMLREFFARVPQVEVRHRFFNNEAGLAKWCRELLYLAEPVALSFATHGTSEGLTVHGELIRPQPLIDILRHADSIQVLHFSSCLMLDQGATGDFARLFRAQLPFPISGYEASVDWAASAIIEFTYLDLILARGLAPHAAADHVTQLLTFASDHQEADSPYPPARFRFWPAPTDATKPVSAS